MKDDGRIRVCFLIRQLNDGGAQRQLVALVKRLDARRYAITVMTFYPGGRFAAEVEQLENVQLICLAKRHRWDVLGFGSRLVTSLRRLRPDILHTYLAGPNCLAVILKPLLARTRPVWGVRGSDLELSHYDWLTRQVKAVERRLARYPDLIIANSNIGADHHRAQGFPPEKLVVIPNGIDTVAFQPDPAARRRLRSEWRVADSEFLIGVVARLDPMKDHETFLQAAARLRQERRDVRFVCVGDGPRAYRSRLQALATSLGLEEPLLIWAGARNDVPAVHNALDVLTLTSAFGEGSPNVVGEAMACGTPCVVTDVGDAASLVGDTGVAVPPGDPKDVVSAWHTMLERIEADGPRLAQSARERIECEFGVERLVARTATVLESLV
jgi:glycosyltransferase involved in cell wall biosynthesis